MEEYVEARSLASLNYLAANPPQYPKKPNEEKQHPITLYISRVPGTRDIILSTLKPQVKNVTAEDVANSFYYVHLNTPEDEALIPPPGQPKPSSSPRTSGESSRSGNQIHRKPVPGTSSLASSRIDENVQLPPSGKENQPGTGSVQFPIRTAIQQPGSSAPLSERPPQSQFATPTSPIQRKPLGSRPGNLEASERSLPPLPVSNQPPNYQAASNADIPPPLPARPSDQPTLQQLTDQYASSYADGRSPSPKSPTRPFTPFSLTLIRRDPSSGQQWNVGKVASFQLENPELVSDDKHHQPSPSISIQLETSGYAKFRGMPTHTAADIRSSLDIRPGSASSGSRLQRPDIHGPASNTFERQVMMAYSKSFATNLREKFHHRSRSEEDRLGLPSIQTQQHGRHSSQGSIASFGADFDGGGAPVITQPAPGLKARGYVFYSPWGGRCEFVTGNAGRSLRCNHILPTYGGAVFNPLVDGHESGNGGHKARGQPISELRFNLPSSELFAEKRSTEGGVRARDQLQSQINKVFHGLEHDEDGDWHLDLSLGREKAGGGNKGKRAKMGKLIIFDEGLKMLDLAVAANVGVWWTAWERTY
ncbi:hypothetical protein K445DRAFT_370341 [Daldinia sp. EC12]|nr:hypothetical protein F4774DRAFT_83624 [Daldinia eschscholtzii]OTB11304.1 hypothetical protein K445DRAFT_370341 [Daldinia sp. EC12]